MTSNRPAFFAVCFAVLSGGVMSLTGCSQYSDNGLVGDYVVASKCPANGCADQAADPNYISLRASTTSISTTAGGDRVDISGDCYPSIYPQNLINITVTQNTGAVIPVETFSVDPVAGAPHCKSGHFQLSLATSGLPLNSTFTVRLSLIGIENTGVQHSNVANGMATVSLRTHP